MKIIDELIINGYSIRDIAVITGKSRGSVEYYLKKNGLKTVFAENIYGKQVRRRQNLPSFASTEEKLSWTYCDFHFLKGENRIRAKSLRKLSSSIGIYLLTNKNSSRVWFLFGENQTEIKEILQKEKITKLIADKLYIPICKQLNIELRLPSNNRKIPNSCLGSRCDKLFGVLREKVIPRLIAKRKQLAIDKKTFDRDYEDLIILTYISVLKLLNVKIENEYEVIKYCLKLANERRKANLYANAQLPKT